ncbi:hypothetical protein LINPERPRIM_LOCUS30038, partial [Linum perenne]
IITNPYLLLSRVLKGKYYHSSSLLEARGGSHPSYDWQSLLHGRYLLKPGLRWQIVSGYTLSSYSTN